jgi:hypothetical protein
MTTSGQMSGIVISSLNLINILGNEGRARRPDLG